MKENKLRNRNGITLIALVITIIVLLILAGVAIATLTGQGNIIGNAENAVGKYNNSVANEQQLLNEIEKYFIENSNIKEDDEVDNTDDQWVSVGEIFQNASPWDEEYDPNKLHIGDFIAYDAGIWTQDEINNIKVGLKGSETTANGSTDLPTENYQFGGFTAGMSKNKSVVQNGYVQEVTENGQKQPLEGWRLFDVNEDTRAITLISAGVTEYYNHPESVTFENFRNIPDEFARGYTSNYLLTNKVDLGLDVLYEWEDRLNLEGTGLIEGMTLNLQPDYYKENYTTRSWNAYLNEAQGAVGTMILTKERLYDWFAKRFGGFDVIFEDTMYDLEYKVGHNIALTNSDNEFWLPKHTEIGISEEENIVSFMPDNGFIQDGMYGGTLGIRTIVILSPDVKISKESIDVKKIKGDNWSEEIKIWDLKYNEKEETNKEQLTVTFYIDENNIITKKVKFGESVTPPEINGEIIERWRTYTSLSDSIVDLTNITEDMYLFPAT